MSERIITKVATPKVQTEGGGFLVRKVIGTVIPTCDPFLMLDHIGPVEYKPGEALGAPDHPHRGFETVTYVIDGEIRHQDSAGNSGVLKPGWIQWMTAGKGLIHSEMPTENLINNGGKVEGFQLWINLPAKEKMIEPRYQDIPSEKIPVAKTADNKVTVKVLSGESLGVSAVIETKIPIIMLDIHLQPGSSFTQHVPLSHTGFCYVWRGAGFLGSNKLPVHMGQVGVLSDKGTEFHIHAEETKDCHALLIAGKPINEPIVNYGPFVMNTQEEIDQAIEDYRAGKLGQIPGEAERVRQTEAAQALNKKNKNNL
ncbi:hypothetical protein LOTGIDRAFT_155124 [Lottia gigantea]|uniref:Pirin n=1 Tax=Lottia gigantea TaxID=225164 RepID=V4B9K3_LOTGI|nr:hypothetical protein LOTGIDRAFT_155124 [Lottia gigantea]ESO85634.1 hypothetical protein LOTGIDRAFT_155124 [Lottia gigantea]